MPVKPVFSQGTPAGQGPVNQPAPAGQSRLKPVFSTPTAGGSISVDAVEPTETNNEGPSGAALAGGAAAVGGIGYLATKLAKGPGLVGRLGKIGQYILAARQQGMLSGLAPVKSVLGNVGAGIEQAAEGKGFGALKEILSKQTVKDAVRAMKTPTAMQNNPAGHGGVDLPGWLAAPGRFMSGMDEATRNALQRGGEIPRMVSAKAAELQRAGKSYEDAWDAARKLGIKEAENAVLQTPLIGQVGEAFQKGGPMTQFLFPFRRTPFNQFSEGLKRLPGAEGGSARAKAIYMGTGAVHGAVTSDDQTPESVALATALASRYGLPYVAAVLGGRVLAGGSRPLNVASQATPVSDYGFEQGIVSPMAGFEPAGYRLLKKKLGLEE